MTCNHIMLDLETLANRPDAAVIQIAAVAFDPHTGETGAEFNRHVCDIAGRHVDAGTVAWWMCQSVAPAMGAAMQATQGLLLRAALIDLANWMRLAPKPAGVWSHGATYDLPILEHAFVTELQCKPPWGYRTPRDTRTIYALTSGGVPPAHVPVDSAGKHDALADCRTQIRQLVAALAMLAARGVVIDGALSAPCPYSPSCQGHGGRAPTGEHYDCVGPAGVQWVDGVAE